MLHREEPEGLVVIAQRSHEWLTGQLARAWGNEAFGPVEPWEEVCLAAEQHGLGWLAYEAAPTLNPQTGRPYALFELPLAQLLDILAPTPRWTLSQGRYPALLVSLHIAGFSGRWLRDPQRSPLGPLDAADVDRLRAVVEREQAFQAALLAGLRADPHYAAHETPERLARNQRLVAAWDRISLAVCGGLHTAWSLAGVPTADSETALVLTPADGDPTRLTVAPWPFRADHMRVVCEGRRLPGRCADTAALHAALADAPWLTIVTHLRPG